MKLVSSENVVFVPLRVKHIIYLKNHLEYVSKGPSDDPLPLILAAHFSELLKTLDVL